ncbi:MAG: hypothetical protein J6X84_07310 [Treponema sp.]|nr:hypothetical protein [Treponema sp.]
MKKFLLCLFIFAAIIPAAFSNDDDSYDSDKVFGVTPGIRLSVLGLEPTVALDIYNLEIEGACAFSSGLDGDQFGFAPSVSVAYISNPFERGASAAFGLEYMYLTKSYTNMLTKTINNKDKDDFVSGIHGLSFFYKGCVNFNSVVGLLWRLRLPLMIAGSAEDEYFNLNVTNLPGFAGCFLIGICTTSIGVKFTL